MKNLLALICLSFICTTTSTMANDFKVVNSRPNDFVNLSKVIPQIQVDMRYYSTHNFIGKRINGYLAPVCLLTMPTINALKNVEEKLLSMNLTLKVYDCYRPQMAVDEFVNWASQINDTKMQTEFYPTISKENLFKDVYIAYHSGHSRGSTVDLTIVPLNSQIPQYDAKAPLVSCTAVQKHRFQDNSLDFGTSFDCFSPISHPNYKKLSVQIKANRLLLQNLMEQAGFKPTDTEWWHFTLNNEPYPNTYFNFSVQ